MFRHKGNMRNLAGIVTGTIIALVGNPYNAAADQTAREAGRRPVAPAGTYNNATPSLPDAGMQLPNATPQLPNAVPQLPNAVPQLPNAVPQLPNAVPQLPNAVPALPNAVPQLPYAAPPLSTGRRRVPAVEQRPDRH
jgi:hypothetical protein